MTYLQAEETLKELKWIRFRAYFACCLTALCFGAGMAVLSHLATMTAEIKAIRENTSPK